MARRIKPLPEGDMPWRSGDPNRKVGINVPMPEPLMIQLDYLIANRAIFSKSSFIRDTVQRAAEEEVRRLWRVQEAIRRMDEDALIPVPRRRKGDRFA